MKFSPKDNLRKVCNDPFIKFHCSEVGHAASRKFLNTLTET